MKERRRFKPVPPAKLDEDEVLHALNNILEYTHGQKGHELVALRGINEHYAKAVSNKRGEYYFAFSPRTRREGDYLQIVTVFRRKDPSAAPLWDTFGNPVSNVEVVDNMRSETGSEWVQGFHWDSVAHLFSKAVVIPVNPVCRERTRRRA
jgi:hypothetical protein